MAEAGIRSCRGLGSVTTGMMPCITNNDIILQEWVVTSCQCLLRVFVFPRRTVFYFVAWSRNNETKRLIKIKQNLTDHGNSNESFLFGYYNCSTRSKKMQVICRSGIGDLISDSNPILSKSEFQGSGLIWTLGICSHEYKFWPIVGIYWSRSDYRQPRNTNMY